MKVFISSYVYFPIYVFFLMVFIFFYYRFPAIWLWCSLVWFYLCLSCLRFIKLLESLFLVFINFRKCSAISLQIFFLPFFLQPLLEIQLHIGPLKFSHGSLRLHFYFLSSLGFNLWGSCCYIFKFANLCFYRDLFLLSLPTEFFRNCIYVKEIRFGSPLYLLLCASLCSSFSLKPSSYLS